MVAIAQHIEQNPAGFFGWLFVPTEHLWNTFWVQNPAWGTWEMWRTGVSILWRLAGEPGRQSKSQTRGRETFHKALSQHRYPHRFSNWEMRGLDHLSIQMPRFCLLRGYTEHDNDYCAWWEDEGTAWLPQRQPLPDPWYTPNVLPFCTFASCTWNASLPTLLLPDPLPWSFSWLQWFWLSKTFKVFRSLSSN